MLYLSTCQYFFSEWFDQDERSNTKVYVSNLPLDITEQEFVDVMQKCGLVMKDPDTNKMKIKLYHEPGDPTVLKGDGLCTYIKVQRFSFSFLLKMVKTNIGHFVDFFSNIFFRENLWSWH